MNCIHNQLFCGWVCVDNLGLCLIRGRGFHSARTRRRACRTWPGTSDTERWKPSKRGSGWGPAARRTTCSYRRGTTWAGRNMADRSPPAGGRRKPGESGDWRDMQRCTCRDMQRHAEREREVGGARQPHLQRTVLWHAVKPQQ